MAFKPVWLLVVAVLCALLFSPVFAEDPEASVPGVVDLTAENFDSIIDGSRPAIIEFYAPWCGHCKNLAADYAKLGEAVLSSKSNVIIAKVNADQEKSLGSRFGVKGFPTLKYFPVGNTEGEDYAGGRSVDAFADFLNRRAGTNIRIKKEPSYTVELTDETFDSIVLDSNKNVLVEFYASWCGHCKTLAPKYEQVARAFANEASNCVVAKVDADKYKSIGSKFGISGFPTIKMFNKDNKEGVDYNGGRTPEDFITYLNEQCGTRRVLGGGLDASAGTVEELSTLAKSFSTASAEEQASILAEAEKIAATLSGEAAQNAAYYIRAFTKGNEFILKERSRLGKLLSGGAVSLAKVDDIKKKHNVLSAFSE